MVRTVLRLGGLMLIGFTLACPSVPVVPLLDELESATASNNYGPHWPPPPAQARVTYIGSIETQRSFEPRQQGWKRLGALFKGDDGLRLVRPASLCVRGSMLAIADPGAGVVHVLDLYSRRWRGISRTADGDVLRSPVGVACLPEGEIVVADSVTNTLWRYDANGTLLERFTNTPLERPTGIVFDEVYQRLWVAETPACRVRAFDLEGREVMRVGTRGSQLGQFNYPTMLAADPQGELWVSDSLNFRMQHIDVSGHADRSFGTAGNRAGTFARPRGVAVDAVGRIFVVDALFDSVQIFDPEGQLLLVFGGKGTKRGKFWLPSDVALDGQGHVYVVDSYNRRVQVFSYRPPGDF